MQVPVGGGAALSWKSPHCKSTLNPPSPSRSGHRGACQAILMLWTTPHPHLPGHQHLSPLVFPLGTMDFQLQTPGLLTPPHVRCPWVGSSRPKLGLTRKWLQWQKSWGTSGQNTSKSRDLDPTLSKITTTATKHQPSKRKQDIPSPWEKQPHVDKLY